VINGSKMTKISLNFIIFRFIAFVSAAKQSASDYHHTNSIPHLNGANLFYQNCINRFIELANNNRNSNPNSLSLQSSLSNLQRPVEINENDALDTDTSRINNNEKTLNKKPKSSNFVKDICDRVCFNFYLYFNNHR